ncbi:MAG: HAD family hydrolase [Dialister sp.]|jgi:histidinol-phosphate phosphatase family protein|nr:HAD family hydrolase [Dialister sp.]MCH3930487.1 HAD family hydrolase [Dialister sp.]
MSAIKKYKVIFLDRDGVINKKAPEGDYIKSWKEFHFLEKVPEAIHIFNDLGFRVIVVSNQRGIARGLMAISDVNYIHEQINKQISAYKAHIDAFFVCPHEKGTCHCRKPDIGLFLQSEQIFPVDKLHSFMMGDSITDIEAGHNFGIRSVAIGKPLENAEFYFPNLFQAAKYIMNSGSSYGNHENTF